MGRLTTDKRERLVKAAVEQFHRRGYARTSLADVAKAAGVAPGNVFYYFKAKDDLARAVVDEWCRLLAGYLADLEPRPDAWQRIEGFIEQAQLISAMYVELGCPLAGLTRDLRQESGALGTEAARIYAVQSAWLKAQFEQTGFSPTASSSYSYALMTGYHGSILLAHAQGDEAVIVRETARLKEWIWELRKDGANEVRR